MQIMHWKFIPDFNSCTNCFFFFFFHVIYLFYRNSSTKKQWYSQVQQPHRDSDRSSTVPLGHRLPILNHSMKMNSHNRIYTLAVAAIVSFAACTATLSVTSYKFQLSSSSDKITCSDAHVWAPQCTQYTQGKRLKRGKKKISASQ